jgi:hypothetical protein
MCSSFRCTWCGLRLPLLKSLSLGRRQPRLVQRCGSRAWCWDLSRTLFLTTCSRGAPERTHTRRDGERLKLDRGSQGSIRRSRNANTQSHCGASIPALSTRRRSHALHCVADTGPTPARRRYQSRGQRHGRTVAGRSRNELRLAQRHRRRHRCAVAQKGVVTGRDLPAFRPFAASRSREAGEAVSGDAVRAPGEAFSTLSPSAGRESDGRAA